MGDGWSVRIQIIMEIILEQYAQYSVGWEGAAWISMGFLQWGGRGVSKAQQTPGQSETGKGRVASHRPLGFEICLLCLAKWCLGFAQGSREWLAQKLAPDSKGARAMGSPQMPGLEVSKEIVPSIALIRVSIGLAKCQNEYPPPWPDVTSQALGDPML